MRVLLFGLIASFAVGCASTEPANAERGKLPTPSSALVEQVAAVPERSSPVAKPAAAAPTLPVQAYYRDRDGAVCKDPGERPEHCAELSDFRDKYWRLVLRDVEGGVGTLTPEKASFLELLRTAVKKEDELLTQSLHVRRGGERLAIPVSISSFVNGVYKGEQVGLRPKYLTPWALGATEAVEEVHVAALSSVVAKENSNFVKIANGAISALAFVNPATAAALLIPGVKESMKALDEFEAKINDANSGSITFSTQEIQIYPRYLRDIDFYARRSDGTVAPNRLYRVTVELRDSLFLSNPSDKANLAIILGYPLTEKKPGQAPIRMVGEIKKALSTPLGENAPVTEQHCREFLLEAGALGLNTVDQALAGVAWLDTLGWNRSMSRREPTDACYAILFPLLNDSNKSLIVPAKQFKPESVDRRLQDKALGEFTVILAGENVAMADKRFLPMVRVEAAERSEILNEYFDANLEVEGAAFISTDLAELFKPSDTNPMKFVRRTPCYRPTSTDTSAVTIETRCMSVIGKDGVIQPYKVTLSLDRSIINEPEKASIRTIRFSKLN